MTITLNTDGASRGNPGPAAVGSVARWESGEVLAELSERIGDATNNEAEYQAVIRGLQTIKEHLGKKRAKETCVEVRLDSELVARQIQHQYKVGEPRLQKRFMTLWNVMLDFSSVTVMHIPREENVRADALANAALDAQPLL